jgi:hypothetical protein
VGIVLRIRQFIFQCGSQSVGHSRVAVNAGQGIAPRRPSHSRHWQQRCAGADDK